MILINKRDTYLKEFTDILIKHLNKELQEIIKNKKVNIPKNKPETIIELNSDDIKCLQYFSLNIKKIISNNLEIQRERINEIQTLYPDITKKYKQNETKSNIYKIVKYIFVTKGYKAKISESNDKKIAYKLVEELNIDTCPYCNRSYISYVKNKDKKTRPQLDHFYPKSIYPFLACSFYNLIPSCSACNAMKSDADSYRDKLLSPYDVKDDDFTFSYKLNDLKITQKKDIKHKNEESIEIILDTKHQKNNEYFQLETIYQNHKDIVIELILKEIYYPKSYIEELVKNGFATKEEIYRFVFSNYLEKDYLHKRPLSKLIRDIVIELKILDKIKLDIEDKI